MLLKDKIYGNFNITSPIILELLNSPSLKRLKKISQWGIPDEFYYKKGFSRWNHSVGVMLFLKSLGASEDEQVAGLLHDVSHTAFSHIYDWIIEDYSVPGKRKEDAQDKRHKSFIKNSEIINILKKYNINEKRIINFKEFTLLERPMPNLCADRIDYSLRELPLKQAKIIFKDMVSVNGLVMFKNQDIALEYAKDFLDLQISHWAGSQPNAKFHFFSKLLKLALEKNIITHEDFMQHDLFVLSKIKQNADSDIKKIITKLQGELVYKDGLSEKIFLKFRYIDPLVLKEDNLVKISKINKSFKKRLQEEKNKNGLGVTVPLFDIN